MTISQLNYRRVQHDVHERVVAPHNTDDVPITVQVYVQPLFFFF